MNAGEGQIPIDETDLAGINVVGHDLRVWLRGKPATEWTLDVGPFNYAHPRIGLAQHGAFLDVDRLGQLQSFRICGSVGLFKPLFNIANLFSYLLFVGG